MHGSSYDVGADQNHRNDSETPSKIAWESRARDGLLPHANLETSAPSESVDFAAPFQTPLWMIVTVVTLLMCGIGYMAHWAFWSLVPWLFG